MPNIRNNTKNPNQNAGKIVLKKNGDVDTLVIICRTPNEAVELLVLNLFS
jgi:hypothetical protein